MEGMTAYVEKRKADYVGMRERAADPAESAKWRDSNIKDDPVTQSNTPGTITYAMAGPNTRGEAEGHTTSSAPLSCRICQPSS